MPLVEAYETTEALAEALGIDRMSLWRQAKRGSPAKALAALEANCETLLDRRARFERVLAKVARRGG